MLHLLSEFHRHSSKKEEISICCPFCITRGKTPDVGYHLGVNLKKRVFHCFRCSASGSTSKLKELLSLTEFNTPDQSLDQLRVRAENLYPVLSDIKPKSLEIEKISVPLNHETPIAYEYMTKRNFTDEDIEKYRLRVGMPYREEESGREIHRWRGRVLFPFYEDQIVTFIVGRTYVDAKPKYLNSTGGKSSAIYGIDNVLEGKSILCEGIISKISAERAVGIPAISVLGKSVSSYQLSKIREKCDEIYLSLDGDVSSKEYSNLIKQFLFYGFSVWKVDLPSGKDPDDLGQEYAKYFEKAKRIHFREIWNP